MAYAERVSEYEVDIRLRIQVQADDSFDAVQKAMAGVSLDGVTALSTQAEIQSPGFFGMDLTGPSVGPD